MVIDVHDTTGLTVTLRAQYLIAVIQSGLLNPGAKNFVVFVGGQVEVSPLEAKRVALLMAARATDYPALETMAAGAAS